jgi:hypothetical protein
VKRSWAGRRFLLGALLSGAPGVASSVLAQCAMCGSAAGASAVGRGLSISILFLLGVLGVVVLALVVLVVRASSREAHRIPAEE